MKTRIIVLFFTGILFISCDRNHIRFNMETQSIESCNSLTLRRVKISNDSIIHSSIENGGAIRWKDTLRAPKRLNLNEIPLGYKIIIGGIHTVSPKKFKLLPDTSYTIEKLGGDTGGFKIRIWTDSLGKVYKTSHPTCDIKEGLRWDE